MQGGETAALARLKYYLWDSGLLSTYFDTVRVHVCVCVNVCVPHVMQCGCFLAPPPLLHLHAPCLQPTHQRSRG